MIAHARAGHFAVGSSLVWLSNGLLTVGELRLELREVSLDRQPEQRVTVTVVHLGAGPVI